MVCPIFLSDIAVNKLDGAFSKCYHLRVQFRCTVGGHYGHLYGKRFTRTYWSINPLIKAFVEA